MEIDGKLVSLRCVVIFDAANLHCAGSIVNANDVFHFEIRERNAHGCVFVVDFFEPCKHCAEQTRRLRLELV